MVGSASKVAKLRRCKKAYYYTYVKKLQRKIRSIAPSKGSIIHESLSNYYNGKDWTLPIQNLKIDWDNLFDEEREEWGELPKELYRILRGYIKAYKTADSEIKTLATEVYFKFPLSLGDFYEGYIDWIYEDDRGIWVCDHKTAKTLPSEQDLYMDAQILLYYEACKEDKNLKVLLNNRLPMGVVFNHLRSKAPKEPQILKSGGVSKAACDTDVATYFETVKKQGLDIEDYKDMVEKLKVNTFYKRTRLPVSTHTTKVLMAELKRSMSEMQELEDIYNATGSPHVFCRTMLKGRCSWDCEFFPLCTAELAGMNTQGLLDTLYEERQARNVELKEIE